MDLPAMAGPHLVACTPFFLNETLELTDAEINSIIGGENRNGQVRTVSDIVVPHPYQFQFDVCIPGDYQRYPRFQNTSLMVTGVIYYPTHSGNTAEDQFLPFMSSAGFPVVLPKAGELSPENLPSDEKYPLVMFSHGYSSNPLVDNQFLQDIASHGFIVVALFHGDLRFPSFFEYTESQMTRCLTIVRAIEELRSSPVGANIDSMRIGLVGVSFGGATVASLAGGVQNHLVRIGLDPKVMVGMVPYYGANQRFVNWDMSNVEAPVYIVGGALDTNAPLVSTVNALRSLPHENVLVAAIRNEPHFMSSSGWSLTQQLALMMLRRELQDDPALEEDFQTMICRNEWERFYFMEVNFD
jgi:hypothetical protein